jgi:hypothetical protein
MMSSKLDTIIKQMLKNAQIIPRKLVDDIRLSGPIQPGSETTASWAEIHTIVILRIGG